MGQLAIISESAWSIAASYSSTPGLYILPKLRRMLRPPQLSRDKGVRHSSKKRMPQILAPRAALSSFQGPPRDPHSVQVCDVYCSGVMQTKKRRASRVYTNFRNKKWKKSFRTNRWGHAATRGSIVRSSQRSSSYHSPTPVRKHPINQIPQPRAHVGVAYHLPFAAPNAPVSRSRPSHGSS